MIALTQAQTAELRKFIREHPDKPVTATKMARDMMGGVDRCTLKDAYDMMRHVQAGRL